MEQVVLAIYMLCSLLFILSLGGLSNQETARKGNYYGIIAMTLAIAITFAVEEFGNEHLKFWPAFAVGGVIGLIAALRVDMISMPQLVAVLHSFVGVAAVLVGYSKYLYDVEEGALNTMGLIETYIGVFIGEITFTGSIVAWGKL
jgi:NAD(P) transhydrogenase subunit beta